MFTCFWEICKFIFLLITWANRFFLLYFEIILVHKLLPFRPKKKTSQHSCFWQFVGKQQRWTHFVTDDCVWDSHIWICATRLQIFLPQIELKLKQTQKDVLDPSISCQNIKKKVYFPWENCSSQTVVHDILVLSRPRGYWEKKQDNVALFYSLSYLTAHVWSWVTTVLIIQTIHLNDEIITLWWTNFTLKKQVFLGTFFKMCNRVFHDAQEILALRKLRPKERWNKKGMLLILLRLNPKAGRQVDRKKAKIKSRTEVGSNFGQAESQILEENKQKTWSTKRVHI